MSNGRTYWWSKDSIWLGREGIVTLGENHGPAGPLVIDALCGQAKLENDAGYVQAGFRSLARTTFCTPEQAQAIVREAGSIGVLDELEVLEDGARFKCRISGWAEDQRKARATARQANKRDRDASVAERDQSRPVTPKPAPQADAPVSVDVRTVFDAWIEASSQQSGKPARAKLDPKRRRLIQAALKSHGLEDTRDAVRGWVHSAYHCGTNENGRVYNGLHLVLRDADRIETFRDLERSHGGNDDGWIERMNG